MVTPPDFVLSVPDGVLDDLHVRLQRARWPDEAPDGVAWQYGTDLRAWLFTILHNEHINDVRRSVREGTTVELEEAPALTVPSNAIASLQMRDLEAAIGKLPQEQRSVILLVGLEGMSYDEVAAIVGVPVGTVRSRLSRGRDQLRRLMDIEEEPRRSAHRARTVQSRAA